MATKTELVVIFMFSNNYASRYFRLQTKTELVVFSHVFKHLC